MSPIVPLADNESSNAERPRRIALPSAALLRGGHFLHKKRALKTFGQPKPLNELQKGELLSSLLAQPLLHISRLLGAPLLN
jgi:hypothetical protein